jgi:hypothetical protein
MHKRTNLPQGSPILALDNRLRNIRADRKRIQQREELAYWIQTWNAWMRGETLMKVQSPKGGWGRETFPDMVTKRGRKFDEDQLVTGLEYGGFTS